MRNLLYVVLAGGMVAVLSGCCAHRGCGPCGGCGLFGGICKPSCESSDVCSSSGPLQDALARRHAVVDAGPPSAAITYPYYTTRGPRDFLASNPRSIGP